jgi:two-component system, sensor histidine kinase LadS
VGIFTLLAFTHQHRFKHVITSLALTLLSIAASFVPSASLAQTPIGAPAPWAQPEAQVSFISDASSNMSIAQVQAAFDQKRDKPALPDTNFPIGGGRTVWLQMTPPPTSAAFDALLTIPRAGLASVNLHEQQADGSWRVQKSGYNIASVDWPKRYLYPVFPIALQPGMKPMFVQLSNVSNSIAPAVWRTPKEFDDLSATTHMALAAYSGFAFLIVIICLINAVLWRDSVHALCALCVIVIALTQYAVVGLGGEYLWPNSPQWNSIAAVTGGAMSIVTTALFYRRLMAEFSTRWMSWLLVGIASVGIAISMAFVMLGRPPVMQAYTLFFLLSSVIFIALLIWYTVRNFRVGIWVLAGFIVLFTGALLVLLPVFGFPSFSALGRYSATVGAAIEIPLMFIGLYFRSRTKHDSRQRLKMALRVDPLTGISTHKELLNRLSRMLRARRPAALLRVKLANARSIREKFGADALEHALVYAGSCVAAETTSHDLAARHKDGSFAMLLPGTWTDAQAAQLAQRLIARGLQPTDALAYDIKLQLQVAYLVAPFDTPDAALLIAELAEALVHRNKTAKLAESTYILNAA